MQSPSHLRGRGSHLRQGEGQGTAPTRRGVERREAPGPGRALGKQGVGVGDPGGCSPALAAVSLLRGEGEGNKTKTRTARPQPASASPHPPATTSTCRGGARPPPLIPPSPPPQSFHFGSGASAAHPEPHSCPAPHTYALLADCSHRARALPEARPPRLRHAAGGGLWSPARPLGSYRRSHSGGSCPGAVGGRPRRTHELGGETGGLEGGRGDAPPPPHPVPGPLPSARRSPFMPGLHSSASADTCWSHRRPVFV